MSVGSLARLLRPAAAGIHTVTTGTEAQARVQAGIYGVTTPDEVREAWLASLARLSAAKVVILGVPSDVGAGFARGAAFGPQRLRAALLEHEAALYARPEVVDVGDVWVGPQRLVDAMLSPA